MISTEISRYTNSPDFKALLRKYEDAMETGELVYFDLDDLIDIAEYYHINGDFELSNAVADYCLQLYPDNSAALLFKARLALIDFNDTQAATKLLEGVDMSSENIDVVCTMAEINIREET